jgi:hypothetical protein
VDMAKRGGWREPGALEEETLLVAAIDRLVAMADNSGRRAVFCMRVREAAGGLHRGPRVTSPWLSLLQRNISGSQVFGEQDAS